MATNKNEFTVIALTLAALIFRQRNSMRCTEKVGCGSGGEAGSLFFLSRSEGGCCSDKKKQLQFQIRNPREANYSTRSRTNFPFNSIRPPAKMRIFCGQIIFQTCRVSRQVTYLLVGSSSGQDSASPRKLVSEKSCEILTPNSRLQRTRLFRCS